MATEKTIPVTELKTPVLKSTSGNTMMIYISIAVFLAIALITTIIGIFFVLYTKSKPIQKANDAIITSTSVPTITKEVAKDVKAIYYIKDNAIYEYEIKTYKSTKLYEVLSEEHISEIFQINENKIGFAYSSGTKINIAVLDISSKLASIKKTIVQPNIQFLLWYGENQYSYIEPITDDNSKFVYVNGDIIFEKNLDGVNPRRGISYFGDSMRAEVSPDGIRGLYQPPLIKSISGTSQFLGMFVFNTSDNTFQQIEDSKMGSWISTTEVLYEDTKLNKLFVYNIETKTKSEYTDFGLSISGIWGLHKLGDNLIYWRPGTIYSYSLKNKTENVVLSSASEVMWLDANTVLYRPLPNCPAFDETPGSCNRAVKLHSLVLDIEDRTLDTNIDSHASINSKGYYYCESSECGD